MENEILEAVNEMELGEQDYNTLDEVIKHHSIYEIMNAYLSYEGIRGYTSKIIGALQELNGKCV